MGAAAAAVGSRAHAAGAVGAGAAAITIAFTPFAAALHDFVELRALIGSEFGLHPLAGLFHFLAELGLDGVPDLAVALAAFLEDGVDAIGLGGGEVEIAG